MQSEAFVNRFGDVGTELSSQLSSYSLDIVALIASYVVCGPPRLGVVPVIQEISHNHFPYAIAIACSPDDHIWFSHDQSVEILTLDGQVIKHLEEVKGRFVTAIVFDKYQNAYLSDSANEQILVYNLDGQYIRNIPCKGKISGMALMHDDKLLICNTTKLRVEMKHARGSVLSRRWKIDNLAFIPGDVVIITGDEILVAASHLDFIKIYNVNGQYIRTIRTATPILGICTDRFNHVLVSTQHGVEVYALNGTYVMAIQDMSHHPRVICVDRYGQIWIVDQPNCLKVIQFPV